MNPWLWENVIAAALRPLLLMVLYMLPVILLTSWMLYRRRQHKAVAKDPFEELPLRPAGESLRLKIEEFSEKQQDMLTTRLVLAVLSGLVVTMTVPGQRMLVGILAGVLVLADFLLHWRKIVFVTRELWNYRLGFMGERAVAEELTQLIAAGYRVFHDVPFESYNIDHVIVGPTGVFAIETKTRSKPLKEGKKTASSVQFDGQALLWPKGRDTKSVTQAANSAKSLSQFLGKSTGIPVQVQPIVTTPGWWIPDNNQHPVWALNPKRIRPFVEAHSDSPLSPDRITAICYQLEQKCRLTRD